MSADTPKYWLDCPDCSCRVFERDEDLFGDSESEHCAACGSLVTISTDAESPLDVRVDEHGGAVVARLLAEVEQLKYEADYTPPPSKVSDIARGRIMEALEADCEACVLPSCVPPHTALEVLGAHDDAAREVERLTGELATLEFPGQYWKDEAFAHEQRADRLEVEVERLTEDETERVQDARHAMRLARVDRGVAQAEAARLRERVAVLEGERDEARRRFLNRIAGATARAEPGCMGELARRYGWPGLFDDGGIPTGATPSEPLDLDDWVADDETMTVSLRGEPGGES